MATSRGRTKPAKSAGRKQTRAKKKTAPKKNTRAKKKTASGKKTRAKKKTALGKKTGAKKKTATRKKTRVKKKTAPRKKAGLKKKTTARKKTSPKKKAASGKKAGSKARAPRRSAPKWDYTEIPRQEWGWQVGKYEHCSVSSEKIGLRYWIDDFWDSRGGGSQSYDTFLSQGPMHRMPEAAQNEIRTLALEHRQIGGVHLAIDIVVKSSSHRMWRAQLSFDEVSIVSLTEPKNIRKKPLTVFAASVPKGQHFVGWAFVVEPRGSASKRRRIIYGECRVPVLKGHRRLVLEIVDARQGTVDIKAYVGGKKIKIAGNRQLEYSSDI